MQDAALDIAVVDSTMLNATAFDTGPVSEA